MSKIELSPLPSGFATRTALNARFQQIEDALNNDVMYRDNPDGEPNSMENELDMDGNRIINLPNAILDHEPTTFIQFKEGIETLHGDVIQFEENLVHILGDLEVDEDLTADTGTFNSISSQDLTVSGSILGNVTVEDNISASTANFGLMSALNTEISGIANINNLTVADRPLTSPYATVSALASSSNSYSIGTELRTLGCLSAGDGGAGNFIVEAASGTPDGYSRILLTNGYHAVLTDVNGCVNINQFGINDLASALNRANTYCSLNRSRLTGSGNGVLSSAVTLTAPYIDLSFFTIILDSSFPSAVAITYQATANDLTSKAIVSLRVDGDRDNQVSEIIAVKVRATPTADSVFHIFGKNCNTLLNVDGNVERGEFHVKGNFCNIICLETGDAPDTNVFYISGGQFKQAYVKTVSTTSDVHFNCQSQAVGATDYAVQINGGRCTKLSGELRAITYGAVIAGEDAGFVRQSSDALVFDNLHIQFPYTPGAPATIDIQEANFVCGRVMISFGIPQPVVLGDIASANLEIVTLDCEYAGHLVQFGIQSTSKTCAGSYRVLDRGSVGGAKAALFDRVGDISVYFDGSALPIDVTSTVTSDVINMSLERNYIASNVAIAHNGVRMNAEVRGINTTALINSYSTPFAGMRTFNRNAGGVPGGLVFHDGTAWQRSTLTAL